MDRLKMNEVEEKAFNTIVCMLGDISENYHAASWLCDIEYDAWEWLLDPDYDIRQAWYSFSLPKIDVDILRRQAAICNGWVSGQHTRTFIPMDDWVKLYAESVGRDMNEDERKNFDDFMSIPERERLELKAKREKLLDHSAKVALAIQASGRYDVHEDLIEILKFIPDDMRCCPECNAKPGEHNKSCKLSY
jgi:hypothetical protein